ncbi:hypothetical protein ACEWY4_015077 [Coilia grayii]|uniref:Chloride channel CLIC-like protein 1 n=1 Tax=Coilia grayii TaxID=363190 RepID=A0ABD1JU48_9TELE
MSSVSLFTPRCCLVIFSLFSLLLLAQGQDDDWVDPFDMLNYDATSQTMRKPPETANYDNVPTKRREYIPGSCPSPQCPDVSECNRKVEMLQREVDEHKRKMTSLLQPPTCTPIFKRFIAKLLKEISKLGLSSVSPNGMYYDAKVQLTPRSMAELQKVVDGESWTTGSLDDALSKILVDFKPHDHEDWKWRFEDTFGVELDTVMKTTVCVLVIVVIICSELWSTVSWFIQFRRMFAICFFISIVWNWFYLYKIAFAEHQTNIVKMESVNEKCTGVRKIDWKDNLKEWFRSTWTLQDDPCKKYYEVLMVNPILLVPPTKAISVTITTFITEPLKHLGQGISEFLRALLKDLPITLQIPVLLTIVLSIVLCTYGSAQTAIQHMLTRPLRRGRRDSPPPERLQDRGRQPQLPQDGHSDFEEEDGDEEGPRYLGAGDAPLPRNSADQGRRTGGGRGAAGGGGVRARAGGGGEVRQRRPARPVENQRRVVVETLRNADGRFSGDETDRTRVPEEDEAEREREGGGEGEVAKGDQASGGEPAGGEEQGAEVEQGGAAAVEEVKEVKEETKEKEPLADKEVASRDSQHAEAEGGSGGDRTMGPPGQQGQQHRPLQAAPAQTPQRQGASAPEHTPASLSPQEANVSIQVLREQ